jgi:hypothetical protein
MGKIKLSEPMNSVFKYLWWLLLKFNMVCVRCSNKFLACVPVPATGAKINLLPFQARMGANLCVIHWSSWLQARIRSKPYEYNVQYECRYINTAFCSKLQNSYENVILYRAKWLCEGNILKSTIFWDIMNVVLRTYHLHFWSRNIGRARYQLSHRYRAWLILRPRRRKPYALLKCRLTFNRLHGFMS